METRGCAKGKAENESGVTSCLLWGCPEGESHVPNPPSRAKEQAATLPVQSPPSRYAQGAASCPPTPSAASYDRYGGASRQPHAENQKHWN